MPNEDLPRNENYEAALDEAINEALEGDLRAEEWRQLRNALQRRRALIEEVKDVFLQLRLSLWSN